MNCDIFTPKSQLIEHELRHNQNVEYNWMLVFLFDLNKNKNKNVLPFTSKYGNHICQTNKF